MFSQEKRERKDISENLGPDLSNLGEMENKLHILVHLGVVLDRDQKTEKAESKSWAISRLWQPELKDKRFLEMDLRPS